MPPTRPADASAGAASVFQGAVCSPPQLQASIRLPHGDGADVIVYLFADAGSWPTSAGAIDQRRRDRRAPAGVGDDEHLEGMGWMPPGYYHVDLDQVVAAVEVLGAQTRVGGRRPAGAKATPPSGAWSRPRLVRARRADPGCRCGSRQGCPTAMFLPESTPEYEALSSTSAGDAPGIDVVVEVLGWDEAFLGARTGRPRR